jgi:8-oxo-dGTP diphosphatase
MIVVAGVLARDGKVLIGQRMEGDRHALKWEFPGGKVEAGENPKQALQRELREELGIDAEIGTEIGRYEHTARGRLPLTLLFLRVDSFTGEPASVAFEQIRWETPDALKEYDFLDGDLDFVRRIARGRIRL